jgi:LPXTG-motif cell wall-anchored protein
LLSAATISFTEVSSADSSAESPIVPKAPVAWTAGPTQVRLGTIAYLQIPAGYKFTDAQGAKDELAQLRVFAPSGLLGIVEPKAGGWCIAVQFSDVGYVGGLGKVALNEADILKNALKGIQQQNVDRSNQGLAPLSGVAWESAPVLEPSKLSLEWALRADAGSEHVILYTLRLFARHGVLDLATIRHSKSSQPDPLKEIAQGVSFQTGEAYADFAPGDKMAAINLTDLVLNSSGNSKAAGVTWTIGEQKNLWLIGAGVLVLATCGIVLVRKSRNRKPAHSAAAEPSSELHSPAAPEVAAKPVVSVQAQSSPKPRTMSQLALNKAAGFPKPSGNGNNGTHQSARRKKVFDYNRYFTDLMSAVSSQANQADAYQSNGYMLENGRVMMPYEPVENAVANPGNSSGQNSEMIAHQKLLIEEQKRIIQEQSKLIEEKSRLIAEKNQLLKMQAELLEGKLL